LNNEQNDFPDTLQHHMVQGAIVGVSQSILT